MGFPTDGSEWSWNFRFTWETADVVAATATVVDADTEEAVSSPVTVFTDIRERSPVTAGILFDPESLNHVYDGAPHARSEEHTSELQSRGHLVCRLLLEKTTTII